MRSVAAIFLFFLTASLAASDYCIKKDAGFYRLINTHSFGRYAVTSQSQKCLVSTRRDLILLSVKNPSNSVFSVKNPSFYYSNSKIKLKIDGKYLTGKIISADEKYFDIDLEIKPGDSGCGVFDAANGNLAGLVSHQFYDGKTTRNRIVRTDNLSDDDFEEINAAELLKEWQIFNSVKQYEYSLRETLKNASTFEEIQKFILLHPFNHVSDTVWKSSFLKNETEKSINNIKQIQKRFSE